MRYPIEGPGNISRHASLRARQRGVSDFYVNLLLALGDEIEQKGGTKKIYLTKETVAQLRCVLKRLDSLQSVYLIAGDKGSVITTAHQH